MGGSHEKSGSGEIAAVAGAAGAGGDGHCRRADADAPAGEAVRGRPHHLRAGRQRGGGQPCQPCAERELRGDRDAGGQHHSCAQGYGGAAGGRGAGLHHRIHAAGRDGQAALRAAERRGRAAQSGTGRLWPAGGLAGQRERQGLAGRPEGEPGTPVQHCSSGRRHADIGYGLFLPENAAD